MTEDVWAEALAEDSLLIETCRFLTYGWRQLEESDRAMVAERIRRELDKLGY